MFHHPAFAISVPDNNDIAPSSMHVTRKHHNSIADTIDRIVQVRVATANSIPVFAHVSTGVKPARFVVALPFRSTDRKVKAVC